VLVVDVLVVTAPLGGRAPPALEEEELVEEFLPLPTIVVRGGLIWYKTTMKHHKRSLHSIHHWSN
jgi:hypothetical protein